MLVCRNPRQTIALSIIVINCTRMKKARVAVPVTRPAPQALALPNLAKNEQRRSPRYMYIYRHTRHLIKIKVLVRPSYITYP